MARVWVTVRCAYTPRRWPMFLVSVIGAATTSYLTHLGFFFNAALAISWGYIPARLQWTWWEHRHPVLSIEELASRIAPWN